jgi:hypothetical protein
MYEAGIINDYLAYRRTRRINGTYLVMNESLQTGASLIISILKEPLLKTKGNHFEVTV